MKTVTNYAWSKNDRSYGESGPSSLTYRTPGGFAKGNIAIADLQETELKSRYQLEAPETDEDEPKSLADLHWRVQPRWLRIVTLTLVPPLALVWRYMVRIGQSLGNEELMLGIFGAMGACILLHFFFVARAYWRMDI